VGKKTVTHSELQSAVVAVLKSLPNCWVAQIAEHVGRHKHGQSAGIPDVLACYKGRLYGFEIKVGRDTLRPAQDKQIEAMLLAGAVAIEVRSVDQVLVALGLNRGKK
jgi:hypothetical protein